jgi:hypothetical protein
VLRRCEFLRATVGSGAQQRCSVRAPRQTVPRGCDPLIGGRRAGSPRDIMALTPHRIVICAHTRRKFAIAGSRGCGRNTARGQTQSHQREVAKRRRDAERRASAAATVDIGKGPPSGKTTRKTWQPHGCDAVAVRRRVYRRGVPPKRFRAWRAQPDDAGQNVDARSRWAPRGV